MLKTETQSRVFTQAWHTLSAERAMEMLGSAPQGLSREDAARLLAEIGPNCLDVRPQPPAWRVFLRQFKSPLLYVLFVASLVSLALGEGIDALVIMGLIVFNAVIGFAQEYRAQQALSALAELTSPRATVLRAGEELEIPASEVVPGDILVLSAGDRTAADVRILHARELEVDQSALTGESVPDLKISAALPDPELPLADRRNMAFMTTVVTRGRGLALVVATGMATEVGRIARDLGAPMTLPLHRRLQRLSHWIGLIVLVLVLAVILIGTMRGYAFAEIFRYALSMAVSAIPEGLPLVVTLLLAVGTWKMAQRNALIRHLPAIEALGAITVVCTDKTGTLTRNMMTVRRIELPGRAFTVTGEGYRPVGAILPLPGGSELPDQGVDALLAAAFFCNDADLRERNGAWEVHGDPTEGALLTLAHKAGFREDADRLAEISFSSERRWMATLNRKPDGRIVAYAKGAIERILSMSEGWVSPDGSVSPLVEAQREAIMRSVDDMASQALRVLAFAYVPDMDPEREFAPPHLDGKLLFLGCVGMIDPPRSDAIEAIRVCRDADIQVAMITGDHRETAMAIAREMGILTPGRQALTGAELGRLSDADFLELAPRVAVYARVEPEHKLRIVRVLQERGNIVAMTGDGINDAPALSRADVGISMGLTGTEVAKEASDMVLTDDNFATLVAAVEEGRRIGENLGKVLRYLFATSTGEAMTFTAAILLGLPLPLAPIQILWLNLITDGSFDKTLAMEPAEPDLMRRPPRSPKIPLMSWDVVAPVLMVAPVMTLGTLLVFIFSLGQGAPLEKAQTLAFSTLAFFQWFSAFGFRSLSGPIHRLALNRWMFLSLAVSLPLHLGVIYLPILQQTFHTIALTPSELAATFGVASSLLVVMEGRKFWREKRSRRVTPHE